MLVLCLVLGKNIFHPFLLSVFKMNDTVNFEDIFLYNLCNTDFIMPGFDKYFIADNFYSVV